nr:glycoside hydrolase family 2 TIM barrel-domain containing protein [Cryptosporangium arvum]
MNGETVKLRGACVHHDNGLLGSATIARAEERRVELLKAAGFNAIRSSHDPMSQAMLDACDRLGVLVTDETFDGITGFVSVLDVVQMMQANATRQRDSGQEAAGGGVNDLMNSAADFMNQLPGRQGPLSDDFACQR